MKMKVCLNCGEEFAPKQTINGKIHYLYKRKYCFNCSPFLKHNTKQLHKSPRDDRSWTDEDLIKATRNAESITQIIERLGLVPRGNNWKTIKNYAKKIGLTLPNGKLTAIKKLSALNKHPKEDIFCINSKVSQNTVRKQYKNDNYIPYNCSECSLIEIKENKTYYNNKEITLQLDHINGIHNDNRLENLRWLCANCHSQTSTYAGKKEIRKKPKSRNKYGNKEEYRNKERLRLLNLNKQNIELLRNSNIDFTKIGWVTNVAQLLNKRRQKVRIWMQRYTPDLLENAKKRKSPKKQKGAWPS